MHNHYLSSWVNWHITKELSGAQLNNVEAKIDGKQYSKSLIVKEKSNFYMLILNWLLPFQRGKERPRETDLVWNYLLFAEGWDTMS